MKGITLIELLIVIAILGIAGSITIINFIEWQKRLSIESDIKKIYSFLQKARKDAFINRESYTIEANGNRVCLKEKGVCISLTNHFSGSISINSKGIIVNSGNRTIKYTGEDVGSSYDCIVGHIVRVKMGKLKNGSCEVR